LNIVRSFYVSKRLIGIIQYTSSDRVIKLCGLIGVRFKYATHSLQINVHHESDQYKLTTIVGEKFSSKDSYHIRGVTSKTQLHYQKFQISFIWIEENSYYIST
jgi:hypothetical protein